MNGGLDWLAPILGRDHIWIVEVFVVVVLTLLAALLVSRGVHALEKRAHASTYIWDNVLVESIVRPAQWMVWLVGLSFAAELAAVQTETPLFAALPVLRRIATVVIFTWFAVSFIGHLEKALINPAASGKPMDVTTATALGKLMRMSVIITSGLVMLQSLGYSISGVLAFGGIGGIAVGFAAKDLLANFFGGLMIYLDRPFAVGEWIRSPDKEIEGTVEDIGWRLTRIRTFDKRPLYVPNATFTQVSVENPSRMSHRRIFETVGIRYDDANAMSAIIADVRQMIDQHPELATDQTVIVNFNKFAASSLDFFVYCFTKTTNWVEFHRVKQDVLLKVIEIIQAHGAQCAFPTSTLHIPEPLSVEYLRSVNDGSFSGGTSTSAHAGGL